MKIKYQEKIISHPSSRHTAQQCIEHLVTNRENIQDIMGVIIYKDGDTRVFNSPTDHKTLAYGSVIFQRDVTKWISGEEE